MIPGETISLENLDNLVKQHMAFLIRTVSNFTGRYVSIEKEEDHQSLHEEIIQYREELLIFGLTMEILADHAPKHEDTRKTAVRVAETAGEDEDTVQETYRKKKS